MKIRAATVSQPDLLHEIRLKLPPTDGTVGKAWVKRLETKGFRVSDYAKQLLLSQDFKSTKGVAYEMVVIKGSFWKTNYDRTAVNIRVEAGNRGFTMPNVEVACLMCEKLTDAEMKALGLRWLVVMHERVKDSVGGPISLGGRYCSDGMWLCVDCDGQYYVDVGFAFVVPLA